MTHVARHNYYSNSPPQMVKRGLFPTRVKPSYDELLKDVGRVKRTDFGGLINKDISSAARIHK